MVEWKKLGEIMQIARGASPRPINNFITSDETGVNWIKIGDVSPNDKYITKTNEKITQEGASKSRLLHSGDFVLSNSMSFGRPYILKIDGCIHDGWIFMSGYEDSVTAGYLYEVLNSDFVQKYWRTKANNGGAMTNLNSDIVRATSIPIPSLDEQKRIVGILDTFTDSIENLKQQIAQRRKQFEFYRNHLMDFSENDNVEWKPLGWAFPFIRNGFVGTVTPFFTNMDNGVRYLEGTNIHNGVISDNKELYVTHDFHRKYIKNELKADDVLMVQSGHIGECALVGEKYKGANCHALIIMSNGGNCNSKYIVYYFHTKNGFKSLSPAITGGAIKHVLAKKVGKILIPLPPLSEQSRIVSILDTFEASISNLEAQLAQRQKQYEYYRNQLLTFE